MSLPSDAVGVTYGDHPYGRSSLASTCRTVREGCPGGERSAIPIAVHCQGVVNGNFERDRPSIRRDCRQREP